jgi:hypothetical protein
VIVWENYWIGSVSIVHNVKIRFWHAGLKVSMLMKNVDVFSFGSVPTAVLYGKSLAATLNN